MYTAPLQPGIGYPLRRPLYRFISLSFLRRPTDGCERIPGTGNERGMEREKRARTGGYVKGNRLALRWIEFGDRWSGVNSCELTENLRIFLGVRAAKVIVSRVGGRE